MEPIRREALVKATIEEIGAAGSLDVTVARIARRAGVSSALAHHYFGGKDDILLAAMRHILTVYARDVRAALRGAEGPRARLEAVIVASFAGQNFRPEVISTWLGFYVLAQRAPRASRLLHIYQRRLHANLSHDLRALVGARAGAVASRLAALIDGIYLRQSLGAGAPDPETSAHHVLQALAAELREPLR
ncbi:transcriptional regulator, TetR family [Poseidonocella sedimentorum]|uniref:HTH-type transcriptional regulator BetI n=2 Tax=Poseidonocella sedimentorum TaxID=871652 RepID=A0A1I6CV99_9RHOB|nr:transcriptional regulator, TetR family [Poseidonocella sedimentorum]